jgi:hypothetical protein
VERQDVSGQRPSEVINSQTGANKKNETASDDARAREVLNRTTDTGRLLSADDVPR